MERRFCGLLAAAGMLFCTSLLAAGSASATTAQEIIDGLHLQTGTVVVPIAHATLALTPEFRYLEAADAQRVLEQLWGNPPDPRVLGMLVPDAAPLTDRKASWAVVITYVDDGHVSDDDAAKIDYDKMLKDMQAAVRDRNPERKSRGYPEIELIGWAQRPHYDATTNKLYWAKELAFDGRHEHALNYDIRALGRGGYLSLNAVARMSQLATIETEMQKVLGMTQFESGQRYSDFNPSTDKVAAYGLGALVVGAIAAKAGLFAKLLAVLIAAKKVIVVGFLALVAAARKFFSRSKPAPAKQE